MMPSERIPTRALKVLDRENRVPVYAVWELTLACNLSCSHCGSRAGTKRHGELTLEESYDLISQLADLGTREIVIIGGEAYLRRDWLSIVERISEAGMRCALQTGGFGLSKRALERARDAGLQAVGVSVDGLEATHDVMRGRKGSYAAAINVISFAASLELDVSANSQINALNKYQLNEIYSVLYFAGAKSWQLQLAVAMGNAADKEEIILQPYELLTLFPTLASLFERGRTENFNLVAGNNIGYFGPYEHIFRGPEVPFGAYDGCSAGLNGIGIEADGTIKGCPSLATSRYTEGNVRNNTLYDIWNDSEKFTLNRNIIRKYGGYCAECYYRDICRAGCTWTADSLLGYGGDNPFCHHRALELSKRGYRERIEKIKAADSRSFGTGIFRIVTEPLNG